MIVLADPKRRGISAGGPVGGPYGGGDLGTGEGHSGRVGIHATKKIAEMLVSAKELLHGLIEAFYASTGIRTDVVLAGDLSCRDLLWTVMMLRLGDMVMPNRSLT